MKTILFEITANCPLQTVIFADINPYSHADGEQEVLFSLRAVFKIDNIIFDSPLYSCKIRMTATNEISNDIQDYLKAKRQQMNDYTPPILFGCLLFLELGQLDKGEKYFRMLLKTLSPAHEDFASTCNSLGITLYGKCRANLALECIVRAYILRRRSLHPQHPATATSALKIFENNYDTDHQLEAIAMNSIGLLYRDEKECQIALKYLNQALGMYQRILPSQYPDIASCLGNIGLVYEDLKDYEQAFAYYYRAFEIDKNILPSDHPNLMDDLNRIIDIYMKKGEDQNAMEFYQNIIIEFEDTLFSAHALKSLSDRTLNVVERIDYYKKALVIFEKSFNLTDSIIIYFNNEEFLFRVIARWYDLAVIRQSF
ncbi:unnamed protein product [Rotaria sordida]|uniref:Kinesin light chain n=1 Tax=Rotaria sordida TaxID=392033 RepID=A0A815CL50_9BILA|nr:unnamed protein product [Rotaria sordida]